MKIEYTQYSEVLKSKTIEEQDTVPRFLNSKSAPQSASQGFFLKPADSSVDIFADIHPWLEFGDAESAEIHKQIQKLNWQHPLLSVAFQNLQWQTEQTQALQSFYMDKSLSNFHWSWAGINSLNDFQVQIQQMQQYSSGIVKIKIGSRLELEKSLIKKIINETEVKIRLDANAHLAFEDICSFLEGFSPLELKKIEYIEDPCPWNEIHWKKIKEIIPVALDWEKKNFEPEKYIKDSGSWDVLILKPSRDFWLYDLNLLKNKKKYFVITSQMSSAWDEYFSAAVHVWLLKNHYPVHSVGGCQTGYFDFLNIKKMKDLAWTIC